MDITQGGRNFKIITKTCFPQKKSVSTEIFSSYLYFTWSEISSPPPGTTQVTGSRRPPSSPPLPRPRPGTPRAGRPPPSPSPSPHHTTRHTSNHPSSVLLQVLHFILPPYILLPPSFSCLTSPSVFHFFFSKRDARNAFFRYIEQNCCRYFLRVQ